MGDFLLKCGISAVVCVNSQQKLKDEVVQAFQKQLYNQLFDGKALQDAFDEAVSLCRENDFKVTVCCCAHKHSDKCKWYKYALAHGFEEAHKLHTQTCKCDLAMNKHKWNC